MKKSTRMQSETNSKHGFLIGPQENLASFPFASLSPASLCLSCSSSSVFFAHTHSFLFGSNAVLVPMQASMDSDKRAPPRSSGDLFAPGVCLLPLCPLLLCLLLSSSAPCPLPPLAARKWLIWQTQFYGSPPHHVEQTYARCIAIHLKVLFTMCPARTLVARVHAQPDLWLPALAEPAPARCACVTIS